MKKLEPLIRAINGLENDYARLSDEELRAKTFEFKGRLASGQTLNDILPEAFAVCREAAKRTIKQRHFDVQLIGGITLHRGMVSEMKTGEGKTLVATLSAYLNALEGKGAHIITVNDYLARRDAVWMGQIYHALGLSVGCLNHEESYRYDPGHEIRNPKSEILNKSQIPNPNDQNNEEALDKERDMLGSFKIVYEFLKSVDRGEAYQSDILYGTNNEFGFDYLRDHLVYDKKQRVQRELHYAIVDEIDSILIDEARTPLIISSPSGENSQMYYTLARVVRQFERDTDYNIDEKMKTVNLTETGQDKAAKLLGSDPYAANNLEMVFHLEAALRAEALFRRDKDYVVKDGEVIIVDEFTGRLMHGRRYSEGLHQAIEAKEGVQIKEESRTVATITFQNYFRMYKKLSGMTGTAATEAEEFYKIYTLNVLSVPTNKQMVRVDTSDKIYKNSEAKYKAVAHMVREKHEKGQPVLLGTISIEHNEMLAQYLTREGIPHEILNAKNHEREGEIIAQAGKRGAVTLATNMAGRGVDIILGGNPPDSAEQDEIKKFGGLCVIGTERHESRRIDNQLRGRSGRQGDPGETHFIISLDDELLKIFGGDRLKNLMTRFDIPDDMPIENRIVSKAIEAAQQKVEGMNFDARKHLLEYDDVLNKQRQAIYRKRQGILCMDAYDEVRGDVINYFKGEIEAAVRFHTMSRQEMRWDIEELKEIIATIISPKYDIEPILEKLKELAGNDRQDEIARVAIIDFLVELIDEELKKIEEKIPHESLANFTRIFALQTIDYFWMWYLMDIENLKGGIGLRAYGQNDPLIAYKKEAYIKFQKLLVSIRQAIVYGFFKIAENIDQSRSSVEASPKSPRPAVSADHFKNVGRNDPCPCGATHADGRPIKYKHCHGK